MHNLLIVQALLIKTSTLMRKVKNKHSQKWNGILKEQKFSCFHRAQCKSLTECLFMSFIMANSFTTTDFNLGL